MSGAKPRRRAATVEIAGVPVILNAPGLKQIQPKGKTVRLYWARTEGPEFEDYQPKTVRIHVDLGRPEASSEIEKVCQREQQAMLLWGEGRRADRQRLQPKFNGTVASVIHLYEHDPASSFQDVKASSQQSYRDWLKIIVDTIGARRLDCIQPIYFRTCYREWGRPAVDGGEPRMRRAYGCVQMLRNAFTYGVEAGLPHCERLRLGLSNMRFSKSPPREETLTYNQVKAIVDDALARSDISLALTQALQFECFLRQIDIIGQWRRESEDYQLKAGEFRSGTKIWTGMTLDMITVDRVLQVRTSKTAQMVAHDLAKCELVVDCLDRLDLSDPLRPVAARDDGSPWPDRQSFARHWRAYAERANVPRKVFNMDTRASGITEASVAGVTDDDLASTAGHSTKSTTRRIYKRAAPQISARVQAARKNSRHGEGRDD